MHIFDCSVHPPRHSIYRFSQTTRQSDSVKYSGVNFVIKVGGGAPLPSFPLPSLPVPIPSLPQPPSPSLEVGPLKSS